MIECFVVTRHTAMHHRLDGPSLQAAIVKAGEEAPQVGPSHPVWEAAKRLFPEVFDGMLRADLADMGQLPESARPALGQPAQAA